MSVRADGSIGTAGRNGRSRITVGLGLVAAAGVVAWTATTESDDSVEAWMATQPVPVRSQVSEGQFEPVSVTLPDDTVLWPQEQPPSGVATRSVGPGELLLLTDVAPASPDGARRVTLAVAPEQLPEGLGMGDVVDVWAPGSSGALLPDVVVTQVSPPDIGPGRVEVAVAEAEVRAAVQAASTEQLVLVRHP